jgi:hypothetical protein
MFAQSQNSVASRNLHCYATAMHTASCAKLLHGKHATAPWASICCYATVGTCQVATETFNHAKIVELLETGFFYAVGRNGYVTLQYINCKRMCVHPGSPRLYEVKWWVVIPLWELYNSLDNYTSEGEIWSGLGIKNQSAGEGQQQFSGL